MGDDAIAVGCEEEQLLVPGVGRQWPTMAEDDGLPLSRVLVEERGVVVRFERVHCEVPFCYRSDASRGVGEPVFEADVAEPRPPLGHEAAFAQQRAEVAGLR